MNNTKNAVAITLFATMQSGGKHYTKAGVNKIAELLKKYHAIEVKRRWLFYCLADMEEKGYIRRRERYHRQANGEMIQLSSMISFTLAGVRYLVQKRVAGAIALLKRMMAFIAGKDKRWPADPEPEKAWTAEEIQTNKRRLKTLIENLA